MLSSAIDIVIDLIGLIVYGFNELARLISLAN